MKKIFIKDLLDSKTLFQNVEILGWIKNKRSHGLITFWDVVDSTGEIQVLLSNDSLGKEYCKIKDISVETAVKVIGDQQYFNNNKQNIEVVARIVEVLGEYKLNVTPQPRSDFPIFKQKYTDHVLRNKSLYLRNPMQAAVLSFKSKFVFELHKYFQENKYVLIEPPVMTEMLLYDDRTAFSFEYEGNTVWLSQCCTFQLEAAISAFEKVYSITPSFRSEHSRSDRHLNEYSHLKIEIAWACMNDLSKLSEDVLFSLAKRMAIVGERELTFLNVKLNPDDYKPPFMKISYDEAVKILNKKEPFQYGNSMGKKRLQELTKEFGNKHIWIEYPPRSAEGFPFSICPSNNNLVMAADLIAPFGFGEIGGVAEKICSKEELLERMAEKGRTTAKDMERYKSYIELREAGIPPHGGIGMEVDRIARHLLKLPHVKDVLPYPRLFGRRWNP